MYDYFKKLLFILPAKRSSLFYMALLFLMTSIVEVIGIGIVGPFIALATNPSFIDKYSALSWAFTHSPFTDENYFLAILGVLVAIAFCFKAFVSWFTQASIVRFSDKQQRLIIVRLVREYLFAPYVYHTLKNSSSIVDSVIEIASTFTMSVLSPLLSTLSNILVASALLILLYVTSPSTILILLLTLTPVFLFFNSFKAKVKRWGKQVRTSKESIIRTINHSFGGIKETKIIGCESFFEHQVELQAVKLEHAHGDFAAFKMLPRFVVEAVMVTVILSIVSVSLLLSNGAVENLTSVLGIYALASIRMLPAISNSIAGVNQLRNTSYTVNQIYTELRGLEETTSDLNPSGSQTTAQSKMQFDRQVDLKDLVYRYPSASEDSLKGVSLTLNKGESIAFIGKSGAGKTTLVDIILGLLEPQFGDLLVDGHSIFQDRRGWQNLVGYIPQSIFLMDETLERNIAFGVPDHLIDSERMMRAIAAAQLKEVVDGLPEGIHTKVGERGVLLSGGQRQRVGIARALYHEREILILDEATAALDNETERLVTESIKELSGKKTIITIAHRLSTIKHCDRIYLLERGSIVKSGSYHEVVCDTTLA
ncbi:MAG: ABC transporter ATP-binding protein [Cyanobacteria bacterium P01_F01_bin.150]